MLNMNNKSSKSMVVKMVTNSSSNNNKLVVKEPWKQNNILKEIKRVYIYKRLL